MVPVIEGPGVPLAHQGTDGTLQEDRSESSQRVKESSHDLEESSHVLEQLLELLSFSSHDGHGFKSVVEESPQVVSQPKPVASGSRDNRFESTR
jgi:hypothetical protein